MNSRTRKLMGHHIKVSIATLLIGGVAVLPVNAQNVGVNTTDKQTIKGWGVFPSYHHTSVWAPNFDIINRSGVQQALYNDLGISHIRVELIPGYYDGNKPDKLARSSSGRILMQDLLDHIKKAKAKNPKLQYVMSVWSPPASLKDLPYEEGHVWIHNTTGQKVDWFDGVDKVATRKETHLVGYGTGDGNSALSTQENEMCNWVVAALRYLNSNGAGLPAAFSLQNELTYAPSYDGCVYDSHQYTRVVKKLRTLLNDAGFKSVVLFGPEGNNYRDNTSILWNWFSRFSSDSDLNSALGAIATHSYDDTWASNSEIMEMFTKFDEGINSYPEKELWMTEYVPEGNQKPADAAEIDWAINGMRHFAREMVRFRTQYWFWWMGWNYKARPEGGELVYGEIPDNSSTAPKKTKIYHVLSKLWKSAPPGTKVRELWSDDQGTFQSKPQAEDVNCDLVAFKNAKSMVVLIINKQSGKHLNVSGLTGTSVQAFLTTSSNDMTPQKPQKVLEGKVKLELPARSITVLVTNE